MREKCIEWMEYLASLRKVEGDAVRSEVVNVSTKRAWWIKEVASYWEIIERVHFVKSSVSGNIVISCDLMYDSIMVDIRMNGFCFCAGKSKRFHK